jgi:hypothetical protein
MNVTAEPDDGADEDRDIAAYPTVPSAVMLTEYLYTGAFLYVSAVAAAALVWTYDPDPSSVPVGAPVPSVGMSPVYKNTYEESEAGSPLNTAETTFWNK